jgi:hypothetical protein
MILADDETGMLYQAVDGFCYHQRKKHMQRSGAFFELWPRSGLSADLSYFGNSYNDRSDNNAHEFGYSGKFGHYSIRGQVLDNTLTPVTGATVLAFRTDTKAYVNSATSDQNGNYVIATYLPSNQHFVVAYNGSVAQGATVNTLVPTVN